MKIHRILAPAFAGAVALGVALLPNAEALTPASGAPITVNLKGKSTGVPRRLELPGGPVDANCFAMDLIDLSTGLVIGEAYDCLSNVQPNAGGVTLTDYTVFKFPDGTLIAKSEVDIRETTLGQQGVTHLTGSFPDPLGNDIVWGSGAYAGATGQVRLSGGVDMSNAANGEIVFDCVFVIDLD